MSALDRTRTRHTPEDLLLTIGLTAGAGYLIATGRLPLPTTALTLAAALAVVGVAGYWWLLGFPAKEDRAARHLASPFKVRALRRRGRVRAHARFGRATAGVVLGLMVWGHWKIYLGLEDTMVVVVGPRMNKTTGFAIPAIMEADGAVVVTSNKRDIVDATRGPRAQRGRVWVFDPQGIVKETPAFYWDPITWVSTAPHELVDARAAELAHLFAFATGTQHTGSRDYFDLSGEALMSRFVLAAACGGHNVLIVRDWLTDPTDPTPAQHLEDAGYVIAANAQRRVMHLPDKQQAGIYDTAAVMTNFLTYRSVARWVTPGDGRVAFDPVAFAASTADTLYSISREGVSSMGPLVTALTVAVTAAAEDRAERSPQGRLPVEMRLVLDEVANVCKWEALPEQYSHYGSKGILPIAFLQSWSQGEDVWGPRGMAKLWGSASARIVGGGLSDPTFMPFVRDMVGTFRRPNYSTSRSRGGSSVSTAEHSEEVLSIRNLTALSARRYLLFVAGYDPILMKVLPSWKRSYALAIRASKRAHDPADHPEQQEAA